MEILKVNPLSPKDLEELGLSWHMDTDNTSYVSDEIIEVTEQEAQDYYNATNELYDMYIEAGQYVIDNRLFFELGIPFNLIEAIEMSWAEEVHWHLYGRFDLAGGIDGKPIKLLEFNAENPTMV